MTAALLPDWHQKTLGIEIWIDDVVSDAAQIAAMARTPTKAPWQPADVEATPRVAREAAHTCAARQRQWLTPSSAAVRQQGLGQLVARLERLNRPAQRPGEP